MNGFIAPFNSGDKLPKIPIDVRLNKLRKIDNRTAEEIKKIIASS